MICATWWNSCASCEPPAPNENGEHCEREQRLATDFGDTTISNLVKVSVRYDSRLRQPRFLLATEQDEPLSLELPVNQPR